MKMVILIILMGLLCGSCGLNNKVWTKQGVTEVQWLKDRIECEFEVEKYLPSSASVMLLGEGADGIDKALMRINLFKKCLEAKGYYLVPKSDNMRLFKNKKE